MQDRRSNAAPSTRSVLRIGGAFYVVSLCLCVVAYYHSKALPLGIHTHPPVWLFFIAHALAVIGTSAVLYTMLYILPLTRKSLLFAIFSAGLSYGFVLCAISWAIPNLSVHLNAQHVTREAIIYDGSNIQRRRHFGCRSTVRFGPFYAPAGAACYNVPNPSSLEGSTMVLHGMGNAWATSVTAVDLVFSE